jgi:hypothetical protein
MAKEQKKGNREAKKPKQDKPKAAADAGSIAFRFDHGEKEVAAGATLRGCGQGLASMQKHEEPRRNPGAEERQRQRLMTKRLLLAILVLGGLLATMVIGRLG